MKSLYDVLQIDTAPQLEQQSSESTTTAALPDWSSLTGKQFAQAVLDSMDFREYIVESIHERELPAGVIVRLMDYAWGKPVERVEVKTTTVSDLDNLTAEELRVRLQQRIVTLATLVDLLDTPEGIVH